MGSLAGDKIALYIDNPDDSEKFIKELIFITSPSFQVGKPKIRLHLYKVNIYDPDNPPGEELFPESFIVEVDKTSHFSIDVSKYALKMPLTGIYVGLEYLEGIKNTNQIKIGMPPTIRCTTENKNPLTWTAYMGNKWKKWHKYYKNELSLKGYNNVMFGLTTVR